MHKHHSASAGFSMISVVMALGIASILVPMVFQVLTDNLKSAHFRAIRADYEIVRQTVREKASCAHTITPRPAACDSGGFVVVKDHDNQILFDSDINNAKNWLGSYHIRVHCVDYPATAPTEKAIRFEIRPESAPGSGVPVHHPLRKDAVMEWTSLFAVPFCRLPLAP